MNYFQQFPKITYSIASQNVDVIDITVRVKLLDYVKNSKSHLVINNYTIENEKRPEEVSFDLYGTYDYTWTILILNDVYSIYSDWVKPQSVLDKEMIKEYGSIEKANETIIAYYDEYGYEVGKTSPTRKTRLSAFQKMMRDNENKKNIKVFDQSVVFRIQADFQEILTI